MERGLDTNVLVYAHVAGFADHGRVRHYLLEQLASEDVTLVVTPGIMHEFVHIVTDARRFDPPVHMSEATAVARGYLGRTNVSCVPTDEAALLSAFEMLDRYRLGRKRIADALLVATLRSHDVDELITCDPDDFAVFEELQVIDPRSS